MVANAVIVGLLRPILSAAVTLVNARQVAAERGLEVAESRSTRARDYTSLISVKLQTPDGDRWVEGAVFERTRRGWSWLTASPSRRRSRAR